MAKEEYKGDDNRSRFMKQGYRYTRDNRRRTEHSGYGTRFEAQDDAYMQGVHGDTQDSRTEFYKGAEGNLQNWDPNSNESRTGMFDSAKNRTHRVSHSLMANRNRILAAA